ncbi:MAG: TetR/AcrR family transcriptional regulator [Anaerolineaceae bacterium]|nr:TetR/AcrR family transcriptional regulator [Anaerolineaceae bacterium]
MTARDLILQTALELFNQLGTAKVTTNHIAEAAGISPGNLYYHFQNKPHIIREIYDRMVANWEEVYAEIEGRAASVDSVEQFTKGNFRMLWRYRFFNREMVALMNADPALAGRHIRLYEERFQRQSRLVQGAVEAGLLVFPQGMSQEEVLTIIWIIANHYLNYLETFGRVVTEEDFHVGAGLVLKVLAPYIRGDQ